MTVFDDTTLRAQVIGDFLALTQGVSDAAQMNFIFETIQDTAVGALRELLNTVNKTNSRSFIESVLKPWLPQIRTVIWNVGGDSGLWQLPAPRLEHLHSYRGVTMRHDFLGGHAGVLQSLHVGGCTLPAFCPALSTVIDLRVSDMKRVKDEESFSRLFLLFPRLQFLVLSGLESRFEKALPAGPAPSSLRVLSLDIDSYQSYLSYNLMQHYVAWETGKLRYVFLDMHRGSDPDLEVFFRDAVELTVSSAGRDGSCVLRSQQPNSATRSIALSGVYLPRISGMVYAAKGVLQNVHTIKISAPAIEPFVPVLAVLENLKHLTVHMLPGELPRQTPAEGRETLPPRKFAFDWEPLTSYLPRLKYFILHLQSITVQVMRLRYDPDQPANADDLRSMVAEAELFLFGWPNEPSLKIQGFSADVRSAAAVSEIFTLLAQTTMAMLCELAEAWGQSNDLTWRLTEEVLALCFTSLPFSDRIVASHVSRRWRTISLAYPAIWADLDMPYETFRDQCRLIRMALSRTGCHPVDLQGLSTDPEGIIAACLVEHMNHLRLLDWNVRAARLPQTLPAPLLETLMGINQHLDVPSDFLGGRPARLRVLSLSSISLPETCPVLSTVTSLTLDMPDNLENAMTFGRLFELCPNVQELHLSDLHREYTHALPLGPAPLSLTDLELTSSDEDYDLTPLYVAWRTEHLRDVSLEQVSASLEHLDQFISGACSLTVGIQYGLNRTYIITHDTEHRTHSILFEDETNQAERAVELLLGVKSSLERVLVAEVPDTALGTFLRVLPELPQLRRVAVSVEPSFIDLVDYQQIHSFSWDAGTLYRLVDRCPDLEAIDLEVSCLDECPLTADDARYFLSCLASLSGRRLPNIRIQGFSRDLVSGVEVPELDCHNRVTFSK
ncbi:hypothetical protein AURDEDRAFT_151572 [Auricularia subglabra TFB-10046 SS5]|nr:hypothetical protein AURDEDRAFT_151572 [Auricularia subglabra TFB-10046 SS5]